MYCLSQLILPGAILLAALSKLSRIPQSLLDHRAGLPREHALVLGKIVGAPAEQQDEQTEEERKRRWEEEFRKFEEEEDRKEIERLRREGVEEALKMIVMISGQIGETPTFGSGIIFAREKDRLYIVTANHVVRSGGAEASNLQIRLKAWPDRELKGKLLPQSDREPDLAVLSVDDLATHGVDACRLALDRLADPVSVKRGDEVYPVGNPNGVAWAMPVKPDAISDITGENVVFQSTLIARGHSGGGLLSTSGLLIGMIQADEAPYGRALGMRKTLEVLRTWNLPVQLSGRLPAPPLYTAAWKGDLNEAKLLLQDACTDVNAGINLDTPLGIALIRGQGEIAKLLVEAGAEVNSRNYGFTPLDKAAQSDNTEMVEFLISHGARVDSCCALATAATFGSLDAVKVLLAHGADPNRVVTSGNQTPLFNAIKGDEHKRQAAQDEILQALIKAGANVNRVDRDGDTPLMLAVEHANLGAVRVLLEAGARVDVKNRNGFSPIRAPSWSPPIREEMAALLVQYSSKVEQEDGLRLLEQASQEGWAEVAGLLVKHGVNVKSDSGNKAMAVAAVRGHSEVLKVLLEAGADPNGAGRPTTLVRVLGGGEGLTYSPNDLALPKRLELVKMLVSKGAKVNVHDSSCLEPLYLALMELTPPDFKVAEVLIAHGANLNASLLDAAEFKHRPEVVEFLRRAEAERGRLSH